MRKTSKSLAILLTVAMVMTMAPALVFGSDDAGGQVNRIAGDNRYDTSAKTALEAYPDGAETVIIARGDNDGQFADGLAASYLAGVKEAPILLTDPNALSGKTKNAIAELRAKKAYVLGGELAVSRTVIDKLHELGLQVERITGNNRYATAAAIAAQGGQADTVIIVSGFAPADSLVAGPLAFSKKYPILLVNKNSVPVETKKAIADLGIEDVVVIGGENVVSKAVYNELSAKERYSGQSRIETCLAVAKKFFKTSKAFSIVGYLSLADAVGAAVYKNPIIYVKDNISDAQSYLTGAVSADTKFTIFGGTLAVKNAVASALQKLLEVYEQSDFEIIDGFLKNYNGPGGDVAVPGSVTKIADGAFGNCSNLTSVTIPDSVTSIEDDAFFGCSSLTVIYVDMDNPSYSSTDGVLFSKDKSELIRYPVGKAGAYAIPDSVTSIGGGAFSGCSGLTSLTIPSSVTEILGFAFNGCSGLTSVDISDSVTSIGSSAFNGCSGLTSITIPDSVTKILGTAFSGCSGLTSITIPDSVTNIEWRTFDGCSALASITIPGSVVKIGDYAFLNCSALENIAFLGNMPPSVREREKSDAFSGVEHPLTIIVPAGALNAYKDAFLETDLPEGSTISESS